MDDADDELATLWHTVTEHRDDLAPRLILADALLERGSSRGEISHLQCDGHPTLRATEADEPSSVYMTADDRQVALGERGHELVASSWTQWFPDLSTIVRLAGSWFHEGMLYGLRPHGTIADWQRLAGHRELAMVRKVRGSGRADRIQVDAALYAAAIKALPHQPDWIDVDSLDHLAMLHGARPRWTTKGVRLGELLPLDLIGTFPDLRHLELKPTNRDEHARIAGGQARAIVDRIRDAQACFPKLETIAFTNSWLQIRMTDRDHELGRTLRSLGVSGF